MHGESLQHSSWEDSLDPNEMMTNGMAHMEAAHPEMAADIKAMPKDDPKMVAWSEDFQKKWDAKSEMAADAQ